MKTQPIREFMTPLPLTIGLEQTVPLARARMTELGVRHLPVLEGGQLRGVLTERDVALVHSMGITDPERVTVEEVMTPEPYAVDVGTPLHLVALEMGKHKYGCAVVTERQKVVGIFTSTDALLLLAKVLQS